MGRGKGDTLNKYCGEKWIYRGSKKRQLHSLFVEAIKILDDRTLQEWQKEFNISPSGYYNLRELYIHEVHKEITKTQGQYTSIPKSYRPEAIKKMAEEINILKMTLGAFITKVHGAVQENNTVMLSTIREVFKADADNYIKPTRVKGPKIKQASLIKAHKLFMNWVNDEPTEELPKTFYDREMLKGFCILAYKIHELLYEPLAREHRKLKRERVIQKINLLAEKYNISENEVALYKPAAITAPEDIKPAHRAEEKPSIKELIAEYIKRQIEVDKSLDTLKEI